MEDKKIVTLLAEEGNKSGKPVATHRDGKRRYLVFLPNAAPVGKQVRVVLNDIGKTDKRGEPLYEGMPAPDEYTERWKVNADGTASRVTIATNWLFEEHEESVVETRKLREGFEKSASSTFRMDRVVVWGADIASSQVIEEKVILVPVYKEQVSEGKIAEVKTGEREQPQTPQTCSVLRCSIESGDWYRQRQTPVWQPQWSIKLTVFFQKQETAQNAVEAHTGFDITWGEAPEWFRKEQEVLWPVCACGRYRFRPSENVDGYGKCEACRNEEQCDRCGKKQGKATLIGGRLICEPCQPRETREHFLSRHLTAELKGKVVKEAKKLLAGRALPADAGLAALKAGMHSEVSESRPASGISDWEGYQWYYFCSDGVYGSKFAPAALQMLAYLSKAQGDGLVDLVMWLQGGAKAASGDYYIETQVAGQDQDLRSWSLERFQKVVHDQIAGQSVVLANFLRISEKERQAAVARIHQSKEDYARAVAKGEIIFDFRVWRRRGGMTNNGDGWVIRQDGGQRWCDESDIPRHKSDGTLIWHEVGKEELALRWGCGHVGNVSGGSEFEVVKLPTSGCTMAQLEAVREIEKEIGAPQGAFGLDRDLNELHDRRLTAIRAAARTFLRSVPEFTYLQISGSDGVGLGEESLPRHISWSGSETTSCDNREANVLKKVSVAGGVLELLTYYKYGCDNYAIRWQELDEGNALPDEPAAASIQTVSTDALAALKKKWGAK